ncbi:MAG: hypothetical protein ABW128_01130 [Rhizorhabdus sp.]
MPHRQSPLFTYCFVLTRDARKRGKDLPRIAYPRFSDVVRSQLMEASQLRPTLSGMA